jgi:hypothetical protein
MTRRLKVPILETVVTGCFGDAGRAAFARATGVKVADNDAGRTFNRVFWVASEADLIHEISHVVDSIYREFGIKDKEFRAYLLEWLCKKFLAKMEKAGGI